MERKEEEKIEFHHQNSAKEIVDTMFEAKVFHEKLTRDDLQFVEDYLAFYIQLTAKQAKRMTELGIRFARLSATPTPEIK